MTNRLVVFIHGLGGDPADTWAKFPELLAADADVTSRYSAIESFGYETSKTGATRPLAEIAFELANFLDAAQLKSRFDEIAFITHSQGGLLARRYLCNVLLDVSRQDKRMPLFRLLTFATPHWGAYSEKGGWAVPESRAQQKDLAYDSDSILSVNNDWVRADAEDRVRVQRVIASDDAIVPKFSALGANFAHDYRIVPGHGHIDIVKVNDSAHPSFAIAKAFLLEPTFHQPTLLNVDKTPPVLSCRVLESDNVQGTARFVYLTRYVPLVGRDNELAQISSFLHSSNASNMSWMWIKGQGGVGKSRLALEFCLAWQSDWHAGFLNRDADAPDWTRWQPQLPTLLVVDYATGDTEKLGRLLRGLCNRDPQRHLRRPVRVLLLDRHQQEKLLLQAVGQGADALGINTSRVPDIELATVDQPWAIIEHFLSRAGHALPAQAETLERLAQVDPLRRPLFAMLLADAVAQNATLTTITRESLIDNVILRDREKYWRPAAKDHGVALEKAEFLLAFATVVGGLSLSNVQAPLDTWDPASFATLFEAMSGYDRITDTVAPLAPDLVGECFVLKTFAALASQRASDCLALAWNEWPEQSFEFFNRLAQDFPTDTLLDAATHADLNHRFSRLAWATWVVNLIGSNASVKMVRARRAFARLAALAAAHPDEPEIRLEQANATVNLINELGATDPPTTKTIFSDLCTLAAAHPDEPRTRVAQAQAAYNLINALGACDLPTVKAVFTDLCALANAYPDQPAIRHEQAEAAFNLINSLGNSDPTAATAVFTNLCALATAHPDEAKIRIEQARAAVNLINALGSSDPTAAKAVFTNLRALTAAYPEESEIRFAQALAAFNLIHGLSASDPVTVKAVFANLSELVADYPNDAALREPLIRAVRTVVEQFADSDPSWVEQLEREHGVEVGASSAH